MKKKKLFCALCLTTLISQVTAQELNIPNSFQNGQVADALDLNDNFTAVETIFNAYIFFDTDKGNYAAGDGLRDSEFVFAPQPEYTNPGRFNTAVGDGALESNTLGKENTAVGYHALQAASDQRSQGDSTPDAGAATSNTAIGFRALSVAVRPFTSVAVGSGVLELAEEVSSTVAVGAGSFGQSRSITSSVSIGYEALKEIDSSFANTAVGAYALSRGECGNNNVAVGENALGGNGNTTGLGFEGCVSDGEAGGNDGNDSVILWPNGSASKNTALGQGALVSNLRGYGNTAVGYYAGRQGYEDLNGDDYFNNSMALGFQAKVLDSNEVQIGDRNIQNVFLGRRLSDVQEGQNAVNPDANLFLTGAVEASSFDVISDQRLKASIQPLDAGLDFIKELAPVTYRYKHDARGADVFGLLAQDISMVLNKYGMENNRLVTSNPVSDYLSVNYLDLVAPMIKAIQELDEAAAEKDERIATLEAQIIEQQESMLALIASQQQRLAKLEAQLAVDSFASR